MGVTEYIGARYVPIFYAGSSGSTWETGVTYEPLTLVDYLGVWFISKKEVPSSIGAPNINSDYWALFSMTTHDFTDVLNDVTSSVNASAAAVEASTAAILDTKQELADFRVKGVFTGKILVIGDSYTEGWSPDGTYRSYAYLIGDITGSAVTVYSQGGCGFSATNNNRNFQTMAAEAMADITDKDNYSLVLFAGGYNDRGHTFEEIQAGVSACYTQIRGAFTKARIAVAFIAYSHVPDYMPYTSYKMTIQHWKRSCIGKAITLITDGWKALVNENTPGAYMASDGRHPNLAGHNALAAFLISTLTGGSIDLAGGTQYQVSTNSSIYIEMDQIVYNVYGATWFRAANLTDKGTGQWFNRKLGHLDLSDFPFAANDSNIAYTSIGPVPAIAEVTDGTDTSYTYLLLTIWIDHNGMSFYGTALNSNRSNWLNMDLVSLFVPNGAYRTSIMSII